LAREGKLKPSQWVAILPLAKMGEWLADLLKVTYKEQKVIHLESPPPPLTRFSV
jgi:hypothetical protein